MNGRSNIENFEDVVRLDVQYSDNWCPVLGLKILLKTVAVVFTGSGAKWLVRGETVMNGWKNFLVDIHIHILPGLDDGSQSLADSIQMARIAVHSGVGTMVVTPHANQRGRFENYATPYMETIYQQFCQAIRREKIPLQVIPGMEIFASTDIVQLISCHKLCPIGRTHYFLIEFPFGAHSEAITKTLRNMLTQRLVPVIAHPERYVCVQNCPQLVALWRELGCVVQVNRGSLQGKFGKLCQRAAQNLLTNNLIDVFGSDAHGVFHRTPELHSLVDYLVWQEGERKAERLLVENPQLLIHDQSL